MKFNEILKENEKLYDRKRYEVIVEFDKETPSRKELSKLLATKYSADQSRVIIRKIKTDYGLKKAKVTFLIYNDIKKMKEIELKHFQKRNHFEEKNVEGDSDDK